MTGRYPTRFGYEFTPTDTRLPSWFPTSIFRPDAMFARTIADFPSNWEHKTIFDEEAARKAAPPGAKGVPASEITIAEQLKSRGYHTIHLGKWHLGEAKGMRPEDQGFDESLGFIAGASMFLPAKDPGVENSKQSFDPIDKFLWANLPYAVQYNGQPAFKPNAYMTDYLSDQAIASIKANKNRPFFMYFAPNAIHTPLQATKADYDALPQIKDHRLRVYAAMVRNLDRNVGRILQTLKDEGLEQNTLVIFTSDNGGAGYIGLPDINRPYRGWKSTFFEGGIHAPFFMRWPGQIQPASRFAYPVGHVDIFATAAAAAGAALPKDRVIDGVDLMPFIQGKAQGRPHQTLFWRSGQYKVVLDGDWKLQSSESQHKVWLYDLASDPTERHELSAAQPERTKTMLAMLAAQDAQNVKPMWPSLLQGPVFIDHPGGVPQKKGEEYIYWDN
jgi:arylsulfatase A-like enzyme